MGYIYVYEDNKPNRQYATRTGREVICMPLDLIYITNDPAVAKIAEKNGVDRIMVDLETLGKEDRQRNMNTVKSNHTAQDISVIADALTESELLVRVNPWNAHSVEEINEAVMRGADRIMLPMWKTVEEVTAFFDAIGGRTHSTLLLETKEAVACLDRVLEDPRVEEIHIGLNDLHLSYGQTFMFEPLSTGMVDALCEKCRAKGVKYGFGGVARIGEGTLPAERIVMEHYRLGSTLVILSRSFCNYTDIKDMEQIAVIFEKHMKNLRDYEASLANATAQDFAENKEEVARCVERIVQMTQSKCVGVH